MAWRPTEWLINGELDNRTPGKVHGWMKFAGLRGMVTFELTGDFHRDIRGSLIAFTGDGELADKAQAKEYMSGFAKIQTGKVGDITAGKPPHDYSAYPYIEWYGDKNGRVVLELDNNQIEIKTSPIPYIESDPVDRQVQAQNMTNFMQGMMDTLGVPGIVVSGLGKQAPNPQDN